MKNLSAIIFALFMCFTAWGQTSVQFHLADPQFGTSQTSNALVTVRLWSIGQNGMQLLPVRLYQTSDVNGVATFSNLFAATQGSWYYWTVSPTNSSQLIQGNFYLSSTNLGLISESLIDQVNGAPVYPNGTWAYSSQASDLRYSQSTNITANFTTQSQLNNASNVLVSTIIATNGAVLTVATNLYYQSGFNVTNLATALTNDVFNSNVNGTNFANSIGLAGSNNVIASASATLLAATNYDNVRWTNLTIIVTNNSAANSNYTFNASVSGTNTAYQLAGGNTNFSLLIGQGATNLANGLALALTNDVMTASNNMQGVLILTNGLNLATTTNLINGVSVNSTNLAIALSNSVAQVGVNLTNVATAGSNNVAATGLALTNLIYSLGLNETNFGYQIGQAGTNLSYTIGQAGTNNAILVFQNASNLAYSLLNNSTNNGYGIFQSASNLSYTLALNGSNNVTQSSAATLLTATNYENVQRTNTLVIITNNLNLVSVNMTNLSVAGSNNVAATGLANTNLSYLIGLGNTNLSYQLGLNGSNNVTASVAAGVLTATNLANVNFTNGLVVSTNLYNSSIAAVIATNTANLIIDTNLANAVAVSLTNNIFNLTNFVLNTGLALTNFGYAIGANGSNNVLVASNSLQASLIASNTANLVITTNLINGVSVSLTNVATAISNSIAGFYPATVANSNLTLYVRSLVENNTNFLVSITAGSALANGTNVLKSFGVWTNISGAGYISNSIIYVSGVAFYGSASGYPNGPWTNISGSLPVPSTYFMPKGTVGGTGILITNFYGINTIQIPGIVTNGSNPYFGNVQATNVTATNFYGGNYYGNGANLSGLVATATNVLVTVASFNGVTNSVVITSNLVAINIGISNIVGTNILGQGGTSGQLLTYNNLTGLANWSNAPSGGGSGIITLGGGGTNNFLTNAIYIIATNLQVDDVIGSSTFTPVAGSREVTVGGHQNQTGGNGDAATLGGYQGNAIGAQSALVGGYQNATTNAQGFVGGGQQNVNGGAQAGIVGGIGNKIYSGAGGSFAAGYFNIISNSLYSVAFGTANYAGGNAFAGTAQNSFVAGNSAQTQYGYDFVWSDGWGGAFAATATNQFLIRATNGFGYDTNNPGVGNFSINGNLLVNGTNVFSIVGGGSAFANGSANNTSQTNLNITGITLPLTNTAPANAVTPVIWLVITNSGNVYKVPAYQ